MRPIDSFSETLPRFQIKKSLHSNETQLNKAIKKHQVRNLIKSSLSNIGQIQGNQNYDNFGLEKHLNQLKKSCSVFTKDIFEKEKKAIKLRDGFDLTSNKSTKMRNDRQWLEEKTAQLRITLHQMNLKKVTAAEACRSYEHIIERMKKDGIFFQLQQNNLRKTINGLEKSINLMQNSLNKLTQLQKMSQMGLKDGEEQLKQLEFYRLKNRKEVGKQSENKISQANRLKDQQKQTQFIQQLAADNIQDADIIKLQKYMKTQLFLKNLLKWKMQKIKTYYEPVQQSFFKIKSNTKVKDAETLCSEYFGFEAFYEDKIHCVKHLQSELHEAEQKSKSLQQQIAALQIEEIQIMEQIQNQKKEEMQGKVQKLADKSSQADLSLQKIQIWIKSQCNRLISQNSDSNLQQKFIKLLEKLNQMQ